MREKQDMSNILMLDGERKYIIFLEYILRDMQKKKFMFE